MSVALQLSTGGTADSDKVVCGAEEKSCVDGSESNGVEGEVQKNTLGAVIACRAVRAVCLRGLTRRPSSSDMTTIRCSLHLVSTSTFAISRPLCCSAPQRYLSSPEWTIPPIPLDSLPVGHWLPTIFVVRVSVNNGRSNSQEEVGSSSYHEGEVLVQTAVCLDKWVAINDESMPVFPENTVILHLGGSCGEIRLIHPAVAATLPATVLARSPPAQEIREPGAKDVVPPSERLGSLHALCKKVCSASARRAATRESLGKQVAVKQRMADLLHNIARLRKSCKTLQGVRQSILKEATEEQESVENMRRAFFPRAHALSRAETELAEHRRLIRERWKTLASDQQSLETLLELLHRRRCSLVSQLQSVFPIEVLPDGTQSIHGVRLPPLGKYRGIPLRHKPIPKGSRSAIMDRVSVPIAVVHPLHAKGSDRARFSNGVALLNADIEQLLRGAHVDVIAEGETLRNVAMLMSTQWRRD